MAEVAIIDKNQVPVTSLGSAFETFDGLINEMRQQGYSLQNIGLHIGRSRERVRQILVKHYGSARINRDLITTPQLAEEANCAPTLIDRLRREGIIASVERAIRANRGIWDRDAILPIVIRCKPLCRMCGKPLPKYHTSYCSTECRNEGGKYKNRSQEAKRRHNERVRQWKERNPERTAEINRRAGRRYSHKRHEEQYPLLIKSSTKIIPIKLEEEIDAQLAEPEIISLTEAQRLRLTYDGETALIEEVSRALLAEAIKEVLNTLTPREERILELRFGLKDERSRTLEAVGKEFSLTRERIRQIEEKALRKLRHPSRARKLKDYLD